MKVEEPVHQMMQKYASAIVWEITLLGDNPCDRLVSALYITRVLTKVIEAELVNHPSKND